MDSLTAIVFILSLLGIILGAAAIGVKTRLLSPELGRKTVHAGMGALCLTFPHIFDSATPVKFLAALAVATLLALRLTRLRHSVGSALFSVKRLSIGELLFPISVAWIFTLSQGQTLFYTIALLLLTLADTVGALAGTRYGKVVYQTTAAQKSIVGSLAFLCTALVCIVAPLVCFSEMGMLQISVLALTVALFVTAVEGLAGHGTDNILIPVSAFLLLDYYSTLPEGALITRSLLLIVLLSLLLFTRRSHTFDGGALLGAILYGFAAATLGGIACLLSSIFLFARHLMAQHTMSIDFKATHSLPIVLAIAFPSLGFLTLGVEGSLSHTQAQYGFICSQAIVVAMLHSGTQKYLAIASASLPIAALLSALVLCFTLIFDVNFAALFVTVSASVILAKIYFLWRKPAGTDEPSYWLKLCALASLGALFVYSTL